MWCEYPTIPTWRLFLRLLITCSVKNSLSSLDAFQPRNNWGQFKCLIARRKINAYLFTGQVGSEIWKMYPDSEEITKNFIDNSDTSTSIQTLEKVKKEVVHQLHWLMLLTQYTNDNERYKEVLSIGRFTWPM